MKLRSKAAITLAGLVLAVGAIGSCSPDAGDTTGTPTSSPTATSAPAISAEFQAALTSAQSYIDTMNFSAKGLAHQLKFEKHPTAAIEYAVGNVKVDWSQEAADCALAYRELGGSGMSNAQIRDQLVFEKYTAAQADYAIKALPK